MNQTSFPPLAAAQNAEISGVDPPHPLSMKVQKPDKGGKRSEHNVSELRVAESSMHCSATDSRSVFVAEGDLKMRKVILNDDAIDDDMVPGRASDSDDDEVLQLL